MITNNMSYLAFAFTVWVGVYGMGRIAESHLTKGAKESLTLLLWGDYGGTWLSIFCEQFDAIYGKKHLSWRCFLASSVTSIVAILLLYTLFAHVLGLLQPDKRIGVEMSLFSALSIGIILNIFADYLSLLETRWILFRFRRTERPSGQTMLLLVDLILTGGIIWLVILGFHLAIDRSAPSAVELMALFSPFSIFFYSTFVTSFAAWLFFISMWIIRAFQRMPWRKLDVEHRPVRQLALYCACVLFCFFLLLTPFVVRDETSGLSRFDELLCSAFPKAVCDDVARLTKNEKRALEYLTKNCEAGAVERCVVIAYDYFDGDREKAAELWNKACAAGQAEGCTNLGWMYSEGLAVPKDDGHALELFREGCRGGDPRSCTNIGFMYRDGRGVTKAPDLAFNRFKHGCRGGDGLACSELGLMYMGQDGMPQDYEMAVQVLTRGCDLDTMNACNTLGTLYSSGRGTKQDVEKALSLHDKACRRGHPMACFNAEDIRSKWTKPE